jgi:hypothetical protein
MSRIEALGLTLAWAIGLASTSALAQPTAVGIPPPSEAVNAPKEPTRNPDIHLACHGVASFTERGGASAFAFNNRGGSATAFASENHRAQSDDDLFFDVIAGQGRIKLPAVLVPPIHTGDDRGWRSVSEMQLGETEITGKFEVNFLNKPTFSINRITGHVDLRGFGRMGFSGDCRPYDASPAARIF